MDTHQIARAADGVHNTQYRASKGLLDLIEGLLKAYKNKRKDEHRIEVKVDGKTKFKATVDKYGRMRATKNDLSPDEIRTLHNYFKSMPNPPINPKDFDVIVDGNKVLETKNGNVVKQAQPQQSNAFADTEWVAAPTAKVVDPRTVDSTVVDAIPMPSKPSAKPEDTANFEKSVDRWVATDRSKTAPTQFERTHAEPIPRKEQESQGRLDLNLDGTSQETPQPIDVPTTSADSAPLPVPAKKTQQSTDEGNAAFNQKQMEEKGYVDVHSEAITEKQPKASHPEYAQAQPAEQKQSSAPAVPKVNDTGPIPPDYGLGKHISDDAIVASGDRTLMGAHGSLEAKRLELNDCVKRGKEPGFSHLNERAAVLRTEINRDLPKFSDRLNQSIAQGKYNSTPKMAPGLDNDVALTPRKQETQNHNQTKTKSISKTPVRA